MSRNNKHVQGVDVLIVCPVKGRFLERGQGLVLRGNYLVPTLVAYVEIGDRCACVGNADMCWSITGLPDRGGLRL